MSADLITAERLRELLHYDPETGVFTWRVRRVRIKAGTRAGFGSKKDGEDWYRFITVDGQTYTEHWLAWFYMTGKWPANQIDHRNLIKNDNSFSNLREASGTYNNANKAIQRNNTSGFKGVMWNKYRNKWMARIKVNRKIYHLGYFYTREKAAAAYECAAQKHFGEFARTA